MRLGNIGLGGKRFQHEFDGALNITRLMRDDAEQVQRGRLIGGGRQYLPANFLGISQAPPPKPAPALMESPPALQSSTRR